MHETAYLNPQLTIVFEDKRKEVPERIEYHEPDGIIGFIKDMNKSTESVCDVIYFKGESEGIAVEGAFQYINEFHENVLGFCNNIYNGEGGTHLTGFKTAFTNIINTYARDLNKENSFKLLTFFCSKNSLRDTLSSKTLPSIRSIEVRVFSISEISNLDAVKSLESFKVFLTTPE